MTATRTLCTRRGCNHVVCKCKQVRWLGEKGGELCACNSGEGSVGVGGKGDGTVAEFMTIAAADLTNLSKLNSGRFPRERVTEVIDGRADVKVHGGRDMPVWGDWFDAEAVDANTDAAARDVIVRERINALVNFIETLQEK